MSNEAITPVPSPMEQLETVLATVQNDCGSMNLQRLDPRLSMYSTIADSAEITDVRINDKHPALMGAQLLLSELEQQAHVHGVRELLATSGREANPTVIEFWNRIFGKPIGMADDHHGVNEGALIWRKQLDQD